MVTLLADRSGRQVSDDQWPQISSHVQRTRERRILVGDSERQRPSICAGLGETRRRSIRDPRG